ncbi:MAG: S1 RNA-binding domain-containing protein, partial [Candidatus Nanoarchaeia archaeon]
MFYKKQGIPEEEEYVICTVKKIFPHSIFVDLDEYENKEAIIHISEISPGRIRNIRDFVKEGRKLVCKVLRVDKEKNQIDLSLRRVPLSVKKQKNDEYKQEQRAEKILEVVAHKTKTSIEELYKEFGKNIVEQYGNFNNFFQEYVAGKTTLEHAKIPKKYQKALEEVVKEKIKPIKIKVEKIISLTSESS